MEKQLKDYLHLYLGCPLSRGGELTAHMFLYGNLAQLENGSNKIILRPLSDIKEEDKLDYYNSNIKGNDEPDDRYSVSYKCTCSALHIVMDNKYTPQTTAWLLSKHFDLFNLITDGLAIDKTTTI